MPERNDKELGELLPPRYPFVAVVGPVGIGKSTFTELIVRNAGMTQFQEPYRENPYLNDFYTKDPAAYSFDSQMFFLANKGVQVRKIREMAGEGPVIQDPGIEVDFMIATAQHKMGWMSDTEYDTYKLAFNLAFGDSLQPDILIALKAKESTVISRIAERGRPMELIMQEKYPQYFPTLVAEFNNWLAKRLKEKGVWTVVIDAEKFEFKGYPQEEVVAKEAKNWMSYFITSAHHRNMIGSDGARLILPGTFKTVPHFADRVPGRKTYL